MTAREVADEMAVPMETVRSRLRLGMGKLKSLFRGRMARRAG
jgi:DNA-directed RNA polymerase specialized sigma24 family protein